MWRILKATQIQNKGRYFYPSCAHFVLAQRRRHLPPIEIKKPKNIQRGYSVGGKEDEERRFNLSAPSLSLYSFRYFLFNCEAVNFSIPSPRNISIPSTPVRAVLYRMCTTYLYNTYPSRLLHIFPPFITSSLRIKNMYFLFGFFEHAFYTHYQTLCLFMYLQVSPLPLPFH